MTDRELNFATEILKGRSWRDVPGGEVLERAEQLLDGWMAGDSRMERPKLYDHYALLLLALTRQVRALETRVAQLEGAQGEAGP